MTTPTAVGMTDATRSSSVPQRSGRVWPVLVVSLIALNFAAVAVTVGLAVRDDSVAVEPDYYAKALNFDALARARAASAALGWKTDISLRPGPGEDHTQLHVRIADAQGRPISDAAVAAELFASARAAHRQHLTLAPASDGVYTAKARINRAGLWHVRLCAKRGEDSYERSTDLLVPDEPAAPADRPANRSIRPPA